MGLLVFGPALRRRQVQTPAGLEDPVKLRHNKRRILHMLQYLNVEDRVDRAFPHRKRGQISGKNKWKPDKFKGRVAELKLRLAVNPEVYEISLQPELRLGAMVGEYAIAQADGNGGILTVIATTSGEPKAVDILNVMRVAYNSLKRKVTA